MRAWIMTPRNCLNAHISWPHTCHVQVHSGSHAQAHARLHMAMHATPHQANLVQQKQNAHIECTDGADNVHDARSDLYQRLARHRLVAHNAHNLQNLCSATQNPSAQARLRQCARDAKRMCPRTGTPQRTTFRGTSKLHGNAYEPCAHIAFKRALDHMRIHMYVGKPDVLIACNKRLPRNDNAEFIHGRARQCVWDAHWLYKRTARHCRGPQNLPPSGMLNSRARANAHLRTTLPDTTMARTIA